MTSISENFGASYNSKLLTLAEQMIEVLDFFSVDNLYGIGGDFAANLIKGLTPQITIRPSSNEMHAAFCACGQAEMSGMGAVLVTYTVGSLPCISAAALAKAEQLPLIILSGAPGESEIAKVALHHVASPGTDWTIDYDAARAAYAAIGIKAIRLQGARNKEQPSMAGVQFFEALKYAFLKRQPVFIEVPRDIVFSPTQRLTLPKSVHNLHDDHLLLSGAKDIAKHIAVKLRRSDSPLVLVGENIKHNQSLKDQLVAFCTDNGIPMVSNWLARGLFADNAIHLGVYNGAFTKQCLRNYIENKVDYIIEIETSVIPQDTSRAFLSKTDFIASFENKTVLKGTIERSLGVSEVLSYLSQQRFNFKTHSSLEILFENNQKQLLSTNDQTDASTITLNNLAALINQVTMNKPYGVTYLPEVGNAFFLSYSLINRATQSGRSWLSNPWYAAMGTSIPYARALGVYLRHNNLDDRIVVITGDGGFNFQHNELLHCMKEHIPLTIIYLRNNIYHLGKMGDSPIYNASSSEFDIEAISQAYGANYYHPVQCGPLKQVLSDSLDKNSGINIIELEISEAFDHLPEELQWLNWYIGAKNGDPDCIKNWTLHMGLQPSNE